MNFAWPVWRSLALVFLPFQPQRPPTSSVSREMSTAAAWISL